MATLENYPNVSQLSAKINPLYDCVPASIVDGMEYLTGSHLDIDAMVTAAYGPNWQGATSASRYVEVCAAHGVKLYAVTGDAAALVQDMHRQIQLGHPCLLTEPDVYAPAHPDWSHVLSVYGEAPGVLSARDPFSTRDVEHTDATWAALLEYRQIWVMEALVQALDISMPAVAALFRQIDAHHWQSIKTGKILQYGLLDDYKAGGIASLDYLGDVVSAEIPMGAGTARQHYERGVRCWDNGHVFSLALYDGVAVDPRLAALQAEIAALKNQPAAPQLDAALKQIKEIVNPLAL